jgi:hypothetical protein
MVVPVIILKAAAVCYVHTIIQIHTKKHRKNNDTDLQKYNTMQKCVYFFETLIKKQPSQITTLGTLA